jgi:small-conductance mechanosensitive channel
MYLSRLSQPIWAVIFVLVAGATPVLAVSNLTRLMTDSSPASAKPSSRSAETAESLQKRQEAVAQRREKLEASLESAKSQPALATRLTRLTRELERLKFLELLLAQHRDELNKANDLREEKAGWEASLNDLRMVGPSEPRPHSILLADELRDELQAQQQRLETITTEIEVNQETLAVVHRMRDDAETARRKAKEALESDADNRTARADAYERAKLDCELFGQLAKLRHAEAVNARLRLQAGKVHVQFLTEKLDLVDQDVVFTKEHLQAVMDELQKFEDELRGQLADVQSRLHEVEQRRSKATQEAADEPQSETLQTEMAEAWRLARESYQIQIRLIQQRLREVVIVRVAWDLRFKIFNKAVPVDELEQRREDAHAFATRVSAARELLQQQSRDLMASLASQEKRKRLVQRTDAEAAKWIDFQISSQQQLSQAYAANLVQVDTFAKMLSRLDQQLTVERKGATASDWLKLAQAGIVAAWDYEITAVDDRPITVKKIAKGIILLLIGLYLSRRISRFFGKRMLPRLGMNNGVATAVQSISFYSLVTMFGFVSLELANVPITVFAFLGGAVAIGVGFGSQNVLNNFISGLILLAEQPIRVGDLVEVNGLYGTVEKIGARSTRVKTGNNLELIVPNSKFLEDNVTNWTLSDARMRTCVTVGVAYGSRTELVAELLRKVVLDSPHTLHEPEPIILFKEFGDNALNFEVHFWIQMRTIMQSRRIESDLRFAIDRLFREADITIAFPQRDIHFHAERPIEVSVQQPTESRLPVKPKRAA